ncbi:MAG: SDR family oxidoreductase [Acidimicrobiales bacterium]
MSTIAITGAAGGIGLATRARLESDGHTVIGVDQHDAEVVADLATPEGRLDMIEGVTKACSGVLDGLVAAAGIAGGDEALVVSINYFGAVATLDGLRPLLSRGHLPSAVALSSNSTTTQPGVGPEVAAACLAGDESESRELARRFPGSNYPATKLALAHWVRAQAVTADWIGSGIRLNAIAPGLIATPMTVKDMEFILGLGEIFPIPARRAGTAEEVAGLLAYLLSAEAGFFCGSVIFMDGGTDAAVRGEAWPTLRA